MKIPECDDSKEFKIVKIANIVIAVVVVLFFIIGLLI